MRYIDSHYKIKVNRILQWSKNIKKIILVIVNSIQWIRQSWPLNLFLNIWPSIERFLSRIIISQLLLYSLEAKYKFCNSIVSALIFKQKASRDRLEGIREHKIFGKRCYYFLVLFSIISIKSYTYNFINSLFRNFWLKSIIKLLYNVNLA